MIAVILSAVAEPSRLEAMRYLSDASEHCVFKLMRGLGSIQSPIWYVKVLAQAGFVVDRRDGQRVGCWLHPSLPPPPARSVEGAVERDWAIGGAAS